MGASPSVNLPPICDVIKEWEWTRVQQVIKAYTDEEHDFGIDHNVVKTVTGLGAEEAKALMTLLSKSDNGMINAVTMLVTIICLAEWRQLMLEARLETIFDCMDFSNNGQISSDEMTLLFYCTASCLSAILQKPDTLPNVAAMTRLTSCLIGDLGKERYAPIQKADFVSWTCQALFEVTDLKLDTVYESLFLTPRVSVYKGGNGGDADTLGAESSVTFDSATKGYDSD